MVFLHCLINYRSENEMQENIESSIESKGKDNMAAECRISVAFQNLKHARNEHSGAFVIEEMPKPLHLEMAPSET